MKKIFSKIFSVKIFLVVFLMLEIVLLMVVIAKPTVRLWHSSNAVIALQRENAVAIQQGDSTDAVITAQTADVNTKTTPQETDTNMIVAHQKAAGVELANWVETFHYYVQLYDFPVDSESDSLLLDTLTAYQDYRRNHSNFPLLALPEIDFEVSEEITVELVPPTIVMTNDNFPQGEKFELQKGEPAPYIYKELSLLDKKYLIPVSEAVFEKENIIAAGSANRIKLQTDLKEELQQSQLAGPENVRYKKLEAQELVNLNKLEIVNVFFNSSQEGEVIAGSVELINKSCSEKVDLKLAFDPETGLYYLPELKALALKDCTIYTPVVYSPVVYDPVEVLSCTDCKYAPVDKNTALASTYIPQLVATDLPGGGMLTPETVAALTKMSEDVYSKGMTIFITSAYRSYAQQQSTFNYWVNRELAKGASPETARQRANIYSAIPGHSEHQLGTTLDVRCVGCEAFSKDVTNTPLYQYLQQHAHEYGFVISYPQGKQHLTGYTYEPWHIRYIGVELASELFARDYQNPGNNHYLSAFLREKSLY